MTTDRARAAYRLRKAIKDGLLVRATHCEICNVFCTPVGHHHNGYAEPHALDVQWLCRRCHQQAHRTGQPSPMSYAQHSIVGKKRGAARVASLTTEEWAAMSANGGKKGGRTRALVTNCGRWRVARDLPCICGRHK